MKYHPHTTMKQTTDWRKIVKESNSQWRYMRKFEYISRRTKIAFAYKIGKKYFNFDFNAQTFANWIQKILSSHFVHVYVTTRICTTGYPLKYSTLFNITEIAFIVVCFDFSLLSFFFVKIFTYTNTNIYFIYIQYCFP